MNLTITEANHIVTVSLNRPDVRNAFNSELIISLTEAFLDLSVRKDIRAIVLKGEGKAFCAGADLQMMQATVNYSLEQNQEEADRLYLMFEAVANCPIPVISFVHGSAFGGGLGLIACSDLVICEEKTQFCFSEVKLGIVPAVISAFVLDKVSPNKVIPWMLSGKVMGAQDAVEAGLVHAVAQQKDLNQLLVDWLTAFKEAGPEAVRETKKLLGEVRHQLRQQDIKSCRAITTKTIAQRRISQEGQEGLKSFLDKRNPVWRGGM